MNTSVSVVVAEEDMARASSAIAVLQNGVTTEFSLSNAALRTAPLVNGGRQEDTNQKARKHYGFWAFSNRSLSMTIVN